MINDRRLATAQFDLQLELEDLTLAQVRDRGAVFADACTDLGIVLERRMVLTGLVWRALQAVHGSELATLPYLVAWCQGCGLPETAVGDVVFGDTAVF